MNKKCPSCGFVFGKRWNPMVRIMRLQQERNKSTRDIMKKVVREIRKHIPTTPIDVYYFYQSVSKFDDEAVKWGINQYIKEKHRYEGKGIPYLKAIIRNHNGNRTKIAEYERKRLGSAPPIKTVKEES